MADAYGSDITEKAKEFKNAIADCVVEKMGKDYQDFHDLHTTQRLDYYYDYIGKYKTGKEPTEGWRTKSYFKFTKVKILSAASQIISAANANTDRVSAKADDGNHEAALKMQDKINGQFEAAKLNEKISTAAMDMLMYGTFWLQAPSVTTIPQKKWVKKLNPMQSIIAAVTGKQAPARYVAEFNEARVPTIYNRNIFEMYPYPYAMGCDDGEGIYHRPMLDQYALADLRNREGFDKEVIDFLLKAGPSAFSTYQDGVKEKMTARGFTGGDRIGYDLHFYTGKLDAKYLREANIPGYEDTYGYQEIWAWVVRHGTGNYLLKWAMAPLTGRVRPFHSGVFERVPYEAEGVGVAENMKDLSAILNGSIRLFMDAKKLALPMIAIDKTKAAFPGQIFKFEPLRVWQFKGNPKEAIFPFAFPEAGVAADGLMTMIELAERYADEVTQIPKWTTGIDSKMVNKTAHGISMLMSAQNQLMQTAVGNIDQVIRQIAETFYDYNMEHDPDPAIKGNMSIAINGLQAVMAKELMTKNLLQMISLVINPQVTQSPHALRMLRMVGDYMGIKDVDSNLPKPEVLEAFQREQAARAALEQANMASAPPGMVPQGGAPVVPGAPVAAAMSAPSVQSQPSAITQG